MGSSWPTGFRTIALSCSMLSTVFGKKLLLNISKHSYHGLEVATDPSERHCDNAISSPCASQAVNLGMLWMESGEIGEWVFPQQEGRSLTDVSKFALTEFPNLQAAVR